MSVARSGRPDGKLREPGKQRSSRVVPGIRSAQSGPRYLDMRGWEADERPEPRSLGLLPSGPDPVGEWLVHRQPPGPYIGRGGGESKLGGPLCRPKSARAASAFFVASEPRVEIASLYRVYEYRIERVC